MQLPRERLCQKFLQVKHLKASLLTVLCQRFAFVIGSTAPIKLLTNSVQIVYLVLLQGLKSSEIILSLVLNPNYI